MSATHAAEDAATSGAEDAGASCSLSFAASTLVATPAGERPIASLHVGQSVIAYNPAVATSAPQPIQAVSLHHDDNLVDVTLRVTGTARATTPTSATGTASPATPTRTTSTHDETIHTTTNHPWLTADAGWEPAGFLRIGEPVVEASGSTAVVVAVRSVRGAAEMWDLTVANVHTFAVGSGQFVVHNCGNEQWADPNTLNEHFREHGGDFNAQTPEEYVQKSQEFREKGLDPNNSGNIERKYDPTDGSYRVYDPDTNTFGAYSADDKTITYFKPSPREFGDIYQTAREWWDGVQGLPF